MQGVGRLVAGGIALMVGVAVTAVGAGPASAATPTASAVLATAVLSLQTSATPTRDPATSPLYFDAANIDYRAGSSISASEVNVVVATATEAYSELDLRTANSSPFHTGTYSGLGLAGSDPDLELSIGGDGCATRMAGSRFTTSGTPRDT